MSRVPQKINDTISILPYGWGRQTSRGGRLNADTCRQQGQGGQKLAKTSGRLLWMAPMHTHSVTVYYIIYTNNYYVLYSAPYVLYTVPYTA